MNINVRMREEAERNSTVVQSSYQNCIVISSANNVLAYK